MTVFRINKQERFTQIDNRMITDGSITAKAKGILLYLLSKPNDWKVYESDIANNMKDGKDSINSGVKELIEAGYIHRQRLHDERGRFAGYSYEVFEYKDNNPHYDSTISGNSVNGKPENGESVNGKTVYGKPATTNTELSNTDKTKEEEEALRLSEKQIEQQAQKAFRCFEDNIGMLSATVRDKIDMWLEEFEATEAGDIICFAIELTAERQKLWPYTNSILTSWAKRNAKTMADVKALKAEHEKSGGKNYGNGKHQASNANGRNAAANGTSKAPRDYAAKYLSKPPGQTIESDDK